MGIVNYVRDFIPNVSQYTQSLTKLLKKHPIPWGAEQTQSVQALKKILHNLPVLHIPSSENLILQTDASDFHWGATFLEKSGKERKCCGFASGSFKDSQLHYHFSYKEILAVKYAIDKFEFYLRPISFTIEMDMGSFPQMISFKNKKIPNAQFLRWSTWFSQFSFKVTHIKGKSNIVADFFSFCTSNMFQHKRFFF